ncbi:MAG TPA: hypothetical protein V6C81_21725 [Planktothrix sp.]
MFPFLLRSENAHASRQKEGSRLDVRAGRRREFACDRVGTVLQRSITAAQHTYQELTFTR